MANLDNRIRELSYPVGLKSSPEDHDLQDEEDNKLILQFKQMVCRRVSFC